jgi:sRNA-binding regulator protein Hfq
MRWDALFSDLEAQMAAAGHLDLEAEVAERVRAEQSAVVLADRLRAGAGRPVEVLLRHGTRCRGTVSQIADTWFVLEDPPRSLLIPAHAVATVAGMGRRAAHDESAVRRSLSLSSGLRALARDRAVVGCMVDVGRTDPYTVTGRIDVVGGDYLEVTRADGAEAPDERQPRTLLIPFAALLAVRSGG